MLDNDKDKIDLLSDAVTQGRMPTEEDQTHLKHLVDKASTLMSAIEYHEQGLSSTKKALQDIQRRQIPEYMENLSLKEMVFENGIKLSVANQVFASISKNKIPEAYKWLRDNGHGQLIKVVTKESVHHKTVPAFVKECRSNGEEIPDDLFGVYDVKVAKIRLPK